MNKTTFDTVQLGKGKMHIYDGGGIRLHAYQTNDFIDNEVFIVEKNGRAVLIESPCFFDNIRELEAYLSDCRLTVEGMLLAYHMAGAHFLPGVKKYATVNADIYGHEGGGRALIDNFAEAFGAAFDNSIHTVTDMLEAGPVTIGGIDFIIQPTADAFDIEIPEVNAVYTHMLGHDCHSIVAGPAHADALIAELQGYLHKGCALILTSHYTPEDLKDVETKIAYLKTLQSIAANCTDAESFKTAVRKQYGGYSGDTYLDMTAGFFFA